MCKAVLTSFAYKMMVSHKAVRGPRKAEFGVFKRFMCNKAGLVAQKGLRLEIKAVIVVGTILAVFIGFVLGHLLQ